jgi:anion-transporting  ArsA/GET3 family ATPase
MIEELRDLLDKRFVIVTGKGGVGKSTVAVALGMAAAEAGRQTIVCEVSAQEGLSRTFHRGEVGFNEVQMADNLWAISIDPDESMREYVLLQLKVRAARDLLFRSKIFNYLAAATPGLKELVTIGKLWELSQPNRKVKNARAYDLVIVDAPATGHGVGFLQTPRTFANVARVGPIAAQAETLDAFITDQKRTGVAIVSLPEEMPVNETAMLEHDLTQKVGASVDRIFLNGLYPDRFDDADAERIESVADGAEGEVRAALTEALSERRRARCQAEQVARLDELTKAPVTTLPFLFKPELGVEGIRELSKEVAA